MEAEGEELRVHVLEHRATPPARFTELVDRLTGTLQGIAYRVLGDHGLSEEVVQDSFTKLAGHAVLDRPDGEVEAWLRRVTLNAAFNRARGERRARERTQQVGRLGAAAADGDHASPLAEVLAAEEREAVRAALTELSDRQRSVLVLRSSGYRYAEIAATLGIATGSVGVLLARAERAFRQAYEPQDPDRTEHDGDQR